MYNAKDIRNLTQTLCVLFVEDDLDLQHTMSLYLQKLFAKVVTANNGKEGLDTFLRENFDLVITDISMPLLDGLSMIEKIREEEPTQPIIVMSAHSEEKLLLRAIKDSVDGYVVKPFDNEQLNTELYKTAHKIALEKENELYKSHLNNLIEEKTSKLENLLVYQKVNYEKSLVSMIEMIEQRDTYTAGHSKRVAEYSRVLAKQMGYPEDVCTLIYQAGILHDVGKVGTPDAVLLNPKHLNSLEYQLIQEHVRVGYNLLSSTPMFEPLAEIIYAHHERYDGKGYPNGLKEDQIPELSRIMIVADSFDAMTTNRIYKGRKTVAEALEEIKKLSKKQFHPDVVDAALIVLKDITLDENIDQLPKSRLEQERFAYFYKDSITTAYNQNYLDTLLIENSRHKVFHFLYLISLKNFTQFNKKNGWKEGDVILYELSHTMSKTFEHKYVFRIFGDEFAILSEERIEENRIGEIFSHLLENTVIDYKVHTVNLDEQTIQTSSEIEMIL